MRISSALPVVCTVVAVAVACSGGATAAAHATVRFYFDAPFCGLKLPVVFSIDHVQVGTDTFAVNAGVTTHLTSSGFPVVAGPHTIGAYALLGSAAYRYTWPDTQVTLAAGQTFTDSLPFYCS